MGAVSSLIPIIAPPLMDLVVSTIRERSANRNALNIYSDDDVYNELKNFMIKTMHEDPDNEISETAGFVTVRKIPSFRFPFNMKSATDGPATSIVSNLNASLAEFNVNFNTVIDNIGLTLKQIIEKDVRTTCNQLNDNNCDSVFVSSATYLLNTAVPDVKGKIVYVWTAARKKSDDNIVIWSRSKFIMIRMYSPPPFVSFVSKVYEEKDEPKKIPTGNPIVKNDSPFLVSFQAPRTKLLMPGSEFEDQFGPRVFDLLDKDTGTPIQDGVAITIIIKDQLTLISKYLPKSKSSKSN